MSSIKSVAIIRAHNKRTCLITVPISEKAQQWTMADESTVKKLKEQRSQLKAKLTAARNVMFKLNECNFKSIEQTFVQVDAL